MSSATHSGGVCASCGQPLTGRYCSGCGEPAFDRHALTVQHFITHTLLHETLHLDGKIWRTLRALFLRPGLLSEEYCAGRRHRYVNPVRVLVTAIVVYALLTQGGLLVSLQLGRLTLSLAPTKVSEGSSVADTVGRIDRFGILQHLMSARETSVELDSEAVRERFHGKLGRFSEPLSFTNVLLLAVALYALLHRRRTLFVENGVFSMHLVGFVLLSSLAFAPGLWVMKALPDEADAVVVIFIFVVVIWQFVYVAKAISRFYFGTDPRWIRRGLLATAAAAMIYLLNSAFITGVQLLGGALALWSA